MAKWTLPEGKIYTQADLDAAVTAALREAAAKANAMSDSFDELGHVDHAVAAHDVSQAILALIPDAAAALDRALAAQREKDAKVVEGYLGCEAIAAAIRHGSSISAQGETDDQ